MVERVFTFGVELEFRLTPKEEASGLAGPNPNPFQQRQIIGNYMTAYGFPTLVKQNPSKIPDPAGSPWAVALADGTLYNNWTVVPDESIEPVDGTRWGVEIVSRKYSNESFDWAWEVQAVWEVIENNFYFVSNDSCSTHIHVRPVGDGGYSLDQLQRLSEGIMYWDPSISMFIPPSVRTQPHYARSNTDASCRLGQIYGVWQGQPFGRLFDKINQYTSAEELSTAMGADGDQRYFAWNYSNIFRTHHTRAATGTIEFRLPPRAIKDAAVPHWIGLAITLISQFALGPSHVDPTRAIPPRDQPPQLAQAVTLRDFLQASARQVDMDVVLQIGEGDDLGPFSKDDSITITPPPAPVVPVLAAPIQAGPAAATHGITTTTQTGSGAASTH